MSVLTNLIVASCFALVSALTLLIGRLLVPDRDAKATARLEHVWTLRGVPGKRVVSVRDGAGRADKAGNAEAKAGTRAGAGAARRDVEGSLIERLFVPMLKRWTGFVTRRLPLAAKEAARTRLLMAGSPLGLQTGEFLAIRVALGVLFPALLIGLGLVGPGNGGVGRTALLSVAAGAIGSVLPEMWVRAKAEERQREITRTLPDVVDLLTVSVEAGLGFDAALAKVVAKSEGPLAEEFERVLQEVRVGKARRQAMRELIQRTASEDLIAFLVSVIQADQLGVSIGNVLRVQSADMRRKRRQRAEEAAMKAPIKMLFPMVIFIFPGLFIVLLGPAVIQVIEMFTGGGPL